MRTFIRTAISKINIAIIGLFLLAGCQLSPQAKMPHSVIEETTSSPTMVTTEISVTVTTQLPITIVKTATLSTTMTPPPVTVPSFISTPVGDSEQDQVLWLYETNNGCLLPCWWGIVLGQTEWETAEKLFSRFDFSIDKSISPDDPDLIGYTPLLDLPREVFIENQTQIGVLTRNGIVVKINTRVSIGNTPEQYLSKYRLSAFLLTYGQPSEIWVSSSPSPFGNNELPFNVLLFYPDLGIMALFSDNAILQDGIVIGCPQNDPAKALSLWSPDDSLSFEEVKNGYAVYNRDFLALEETKSIDIDAFYERFKNSANTDCLEIPAEVWNSQ